MLPGQKVAAVVAHQLPELSELSQREVFTDLTGHPVVKEAQVRGSLTHFPNV